LPPIRLVAGTRQFSKMTSQTCERGLAEAEAGRAGLDQEGRDAGGALLRRIGARHHGEEARFRRVGDEALGTVDHVAVAVAPGGRAHGGRVGADIGLGQREGADDLAARQLGQIGALLLLGAVDDDALRADAVVGADHGAEGGRGLAELESDAHLLRHGQAEAAIFRGDGQTEEAERAHLRDDLFGDGVVVRDAMLVGHEPLAHEAPHGDEQLLQGFGIERHADQLTGGSGEVANRRELRWTTERL